jgi:ribosomal protein L24E
MYAYRAVWSGTLPASVSNTVPYAVDIAPVVTTQPANQTVNAGQLASFSAIASSTPTPTVQWQLSTDGGTHWTTIAGATGTTYATPATTGPDNGNRYRAVFTNSVGTATTNAALLVVVSPPAVVTQPASQSVQTGSPATFSAKATGSVLAVQWQISTDGGSSWSNAPGTPDNTFASRTTLTSAYTTPATTTANNGNQFRAVFTNGIGTANSNPATLSVTTTPPPPPAPPAPPATSGGYHLVASNGSVYSFGNAPFYGSMGGQTLNKPIVGTATTPGDGGYWLVASDGGIFSFGNATFYGSMGGKPLNQPIVGIASTPDGKGYWEVASDGGIFAFGDAAFYGSMGGKPLNKPIVGIASTPDGKGYWEVASDGGIFAFGDAAFYGSTGSLTLNKPIVGVASTNNGAGYWLVASDGGVFSFGNAGFHGTVAGTTSASIVSLVPTADNGGYWETASNGQVFQFGDATSAGTALAQTATIVAMSD